MQERRNSSALAMDLGLSCTKPSMFVLDYLWVGVLCEIWLHHRMFGYIDMKISEIPAISRMPAAWECVYQVIPWLVSRDNPYSR